MRVRALLPAAMLATVTLVPTVGKAQVDSFIGPSVGAFFPTDRTLRDALGDVWLSFGASQVKIDQYSKRNVGIDWTGFSKEKSGNRVFMLALSVGVVNPLDRPGSLVRPYFAIRGGASYIDYALNDTPTTRLAAKRLGFNANAEFGVNVGERLNVSARYDLMPKHDGLNFSGFSLALKWGVARF